MFTAEQATARQTTARQVRVAKLFFKASEVPAHFARYDGEVDYIDGEWTSAHRATWKVPEGGFAVVNEEGDWHFFGPDEDRSKNIIPAALILEMRMRRWRVRK